MLLRGLAHPVIFSQSFGGSSSSSGSAAEPQQADSSGGSADNTAAAASSGSDLTPWDPNNLFGEALRGGLTPEWLPAGWQLGRLHGADCFD